MATDLSTLTEDLAARIRAARLRTNLTQAELALRLKVSMRTLQGWEAGSVLPRAAHRRRLQRFLDGAAQ